MSTAVQTRQAALPMSIEVKSRGQRPPTLLLLSADKSLVDLVRTASGPDWNVSHHLNAHDRDDPLDRPNVKLVLLDDSAVEESERGWLLGQIRRRVPEALLLYVTVQHSEENERRARANGALYYIAKPLQAPLFTQVLKAFLKAQQAK